MQLGRLHLRAKHPDKDCRNIQPFMMRSGVICMLLLSGKAFSGPTDTAQYYMSAGRQRHAQLSSSDMQQRFPFLNAALALSGAASSTFLSRCSSNNLSDIELFGGKVLDIQAAPVLNISASIDNQGGAVPSGNYTGLDICNITVTYTHPGRGDELHISVALPLRDWNGRFLAQGGGGWKTGYPAAYLIPAASRGYAVASTDGGHSVFTESASSWILNSPGNVNLNLLQDFSSVALNDLAILGKQIITRYYGKEPKASYWAGCSTGGRQGLMLAQRYPDAFDGILAVAPAINFARFVPAEYWPQQVMNELKYYPPPCELEAIVNASVSACDELDGIEDGIISDPDSCHFNANDLVGESFDCYGSTQKFSQQAVVVAEATWAGAQDPARLYSWYGLAKGTSFVNGIAGTVCEANNFDNCTGSPFAIAEEYIRYLVNKDANSDLSNITRGQYFYLLHKSYQEYDSIIGTSDPDLSAFRQHGGKMITWHGLADQLIASNGTREYYDRVLQLDPEAKEFYRYFEAPGVGHCSGGSGPCPDQFATLEQVIKWFEEGEAPDLLEAVGQNGEHTRRPLCVYPKRQRYVGGDPDDMQSFDCVEI